MLTDKSPGIGLRAMRESRGLTLQELADASGLSKTYLWELEHDNEGRKKPSAATVVSLAAALDTTVDHLLGLPSGPNGTTTGESIPQSLLKLRNRLMCDGWPLTDDDMQQLASMRFRGFRPQTVNQWHQLYLFFIGLKKGN